MFLLMNPWSTSLSSVSSTFGTDPTEPLTRLEVVLDQQDLERRDSRTAFDVRFDWAWAERFVVRADLPFSRFEPRSGGSETGLGDVRAQLGWRAFDERSFAMFFAGGFVLDTAEEPMLGTGSDRLVLTAAASGALPEIRSRLTESIEHFVSFDRSAGGAGVALTKVDIQLFTEWSQTAWTRAGTELLFDWKNGEQVGLNLDLQLGKETRSGFGVWLEPKLGVFGQDVDGVVDWSLAIGVRWLF